MNKGDKITGTIEKIKKDRATVVVIDGLRYTLDLKTPPKEARK